MPAPQLNASSRFIFDILAAVAAAPAPLGLAEISRLLDLPASSAHRGLLTLAHAGFVTAAGNGRYQTGPAARRLLAAFPARFPLRNAAMATLRTLSTLSGETASLWVRIGWQAVRIAAIEGTHGVVDRAPVAAFHPLDGTAAGLAILSCMDSALQRRFVARAGHRGLPRVIETVRRRGYANSADAARLPAGLGFPLRDANGAAFAAIAIEGPMPTEPPGEWFAAIRRFEAHCAEHGELLTDPYGHLDPDTVRLGETAAAA